MEEVNAKGSLIEVEGAEEERGIADEEEGETEGEGADAFPAEASWVASMSLSVKDMVKGEREGWIGVVTKRQNKIEGKQAQKKTS